MTDDNDNGTFNPPRPHREAVANLRDYLEARIDGNKDLADTKFKSSEIAVSAALLAAEKAVTAALAASEKAIGKAEVAQQKVNEGQNEFRATLKDQASTLMPRAETEILLREIRSAVALLQAETDKGSGRRQASAQITAGIAAVAAIGGGILGAVISRGGN